MLDKEVKTRNLASVLEVWVGEELSTWKMVLSMKYGKPNTQAKLPRVPSSLYRERLPLSVDWASCVCWALIESVPLNTRASYASGPGLCFWETVLMHILWECLLSTPDSHTQSQKAVTVLVIGRLITWIVHVGSKKLKYCLGPAKI